MSITYEPVGEPIASVLNMDTGAVHYLYMDKDNEEQECKLLNESLPEHMIDLITEQLRSGIPFNQVSNMLKMADKDEEEMSGEREIQVEANETVWIRPTVENERITMFGESGSGKSRLAANYGLQYSKIFPDRNIILYCAQDEDPAFYFVEKDENGYPLRDENNKLIIKLDSNGEPMPRFRFQEIILGDSDEPISIGQIEETTLKQFENSLVIFDDVDNIADTKMCKAVHKLVNLCYANGRKKNIHTLYLGHVICAGVQNKVIHAETCKYVLFPKTGADQIYNFFNVRMKMPAAMARQYATMNADWLCLVRGAPRYFIYPKGIMII